MKHRQQALSILLTLCMVLTLLPWSAMPARAETLPAETWSGELTVSSSRTIRGVTLTGDVTLAFEDDAVLTVEGRILGDRDLTVEGKGTLAVNCAQGGPSAVNVSALSIDSDCTVAVTLTGAETDGCGVDCTGGVYVDYGGTLSVSVKGGGSFGIACGGMTVEYNGTVTASVEGAKACAIACEGGESSMTVEGVVTATAAGENSYGVSCENALTVTSFGSLTATATGNESIGVDASGMTVEKYGEATASGDIAGVVCASSLLVGDNEAKGGVLRVSSKSGIGVFCTDSCNMTVKYGSTVTAEGTIGVYLSDGDLTLSGGALAAKGSTSYGISGGGNVVLTGGAVWANNYNCPVRPGMGTDAGGLSFDIEYTINGEKKQNGEYYTGSDGGFGSEPIAKKWLVTPKYFSGVKENITWQFSPNNDTDETLRLTVSGEGTMADLEYTNDQPWGSLRSFVTDAAVEQGITHIGGCAFTDFARLASVSMPTGLLSIGRRAFLSCASLTSVTLPEGLTSVGVEAFADSGLTSVELPASLTTLEMDDRYGNSPFDSCAALATITVAEGNENYCADDGILYDKGKTILLLCPLAKTGEITVPATVDAFENYAFSSRYGESCFTSLSAIRFAHAAGAKVDLGVSPETLRSEPRSRYGAAYVFGKDYDGACVLYAPDGLVMMLDARPDQGCLDGYPSIPVSALAGQGSCDVSFRAVTEWDKLQAALSAGGTVKLTRNYDYMVDSLPCGTTTLVCVDEDGRIVMQDGRPVTEKVDAYYDHLNIPAGTTLDLNGHTLRAGSLYARGDLTILNGALTAGINLKGGRRDESVYGTLTLRGVTAELPTSCEFSGDCPLDWSGAIVLEGSTMDVGISVPAQIPSNRWTPPEAGNMLTMDAASRFTMTTGDTWMLQAMFGDMSEASPKSASEDEPEIPDVDLPDRLFLFAPVDPNEGKKAGSGTDAENAADALAARYVEALSPYLPDGYELSYQVVMSSMIFLYVTDAEGNYPWAVTLRASVSVSGGFNESGELIAAVRTPADARLLAASYDADGRLAEVRIVSVTAGQAEYATGLQRRAGHTYKLMLVNGTTFAPLCEAWDGKA